MLCDKHLIINRKFRLIFRIVFFLILCFLIICLFQDSFSQSSTPTLLKIQKEDRNINDNEQDIQKEKQIDAMSIFSAFKKAYPNKIAEYSFRDGDWAIRIGETWFYWAEGRLLPEKDKSKMELYQPHSFYNYTKELPPLPQLNEKEALELEEKLKEEKKFPLSRHPGFYNALWRSKNVEEAYFKVKTIFFLGMKTSIHWELLEDLSAIEEEIQELMKIDLKLKLFIETINSVQGFNYRVIEGTITRSLHSYGIAIDIVPESYNDKSWYWQYVRLQNDRWFELPYEQRFMFPKSFIQIFERHGFIWGGKWFYFDQVHFEYRPEILILNE